MKIESPGFRKDGFTCPLCGYFSEQIWKDCYGYGGRTEMETFPDIKLAHCQQCKKASVWVGFAMVYPEMNDVPPPNEDLSESIQIDYNEAASIIHQSPRGASALLRLALQKLTIELGRAIKI
jgi:hypothetical protein